MRPAVRYGWGNILNLGWAICVASYGFLFYLFCLVAFFLCLGNAASTSRKKKGLVTDGCRVLLGTFSRCFLCFDSPFLLIFRVYVFVDVIFFPVGFLFLLRAVFTFGRVFSSLAGDAE